VSSPMMPRSPRLVVCAVSCLALIAVAACEQSHMLAPDTAAEAAAAAARATLNCVVTFGANHKVSSFLCGPPGQAPTTNMLASHARAVVAPISKSRVTLTSSSQVAFSFSDFSFTGGLFSMSTTLTNLTTQALGTADGITPNAQGTRAVIVKGPTPVAGSGTITVLADSGDTDLTAPAQPYYRYDSIIPPTATSAPETWEFNIPTTATGLQFTIQVTAVVAAEESVLVWNVLRQGLTDSTLYSVWQDTPSDIYAVGTGGSVVHYDGSTWTTVPAGISGGQALYSVFGFGPADIWTVGTGYTGHYNGTAWSTVAAPGGTYYGVWGSGSTNVYAVGSGIIRNPGTGWVSETDPSTATLRAVWGSDASDIWAVGDGGTILFNPGTGTWAAQASCTTKNLRSVWGSSATNVYAVGAGGAACHYDGTSWTTVSVGTTLYLEAVGGSSATDVWVASPLGTMSHFNGSAWTQLPRTVGTTFLGVTSGSAASVAVVGNHGTLMNYNGSAFVLSAQAGLPIYGVWATDTNDIYASSYGTILHYNGSGWTSAYAGAGDRFNAMSGTSDADIYAVGTSGNVTHFNGTTWSSFFLGGSLRSVWDFPGANTIYIVGAAGLIKKGSAPLAGSFASQTSANATTLEAVWGVDAGNIFIVDSSGNIQNSDGSGTWTNEVSEGVSLYAINGLEGVDQLAVGAGGEAYRLTGHTWANLPTGTGNTLRGVWDAFAFDVYAVGDGGVIQHWNGASWLAMSSPVSTPLTCVYGTAQAHIYVGGGNGVLLFGTR
jgi:hypothetical protein